jgi:hypothetical protein
MRDLRDPEALGRAYILARKNGATVAQAVVQPVQGYDPGPFISSDPANHHSKTPQRLGDLSDGAF